MPRTTLKHDISQFAAILVAFLLLPPSPSRASEPVQQPMLRMETGMHTSVIRRIDLDSSNRYILTSSEDRTVRLWELATGRLIKIFRPPMGDGNEGKLFAVALSPDGRTIACGGWTAWDWEGTASIYIFDRDSEKLVRRLPGLPGTINHLMFSRDGTLLAAGLERGGIRVYRASDWSLAAEDKDYNGYAMGVAFDQTGRLASASYDGYVRLYDRNLRLIAKERLRSGAMGSAVSISPDGSQIAVGFEDVSDADVFSGRDLKYLFSPDMTGISAGNLFTVSWSADGRHLYAGGKYWNGGVSAFAIVKWPDGGRGYPAFLPAAQNSVLNLQPLKNGGVAFCSFDPSFGIFDAADRKVLYMTSSTADFRDNNNGFLVSYDGTTIQFPYELWGKSPARFSILSRVLELDPPKEGTLFQPIIFSDDLTVTDWKNNPKPKANGKLLTLDQYERSQSLAVTPDGERFVLGGDYKLYLFDRTGTQIWSFSAPGTVWAVNVSGNRKIVVAAFADGTIRWYRMRDGKELLALFPHNDKKRWVMWSPSGYYDASAGADEIIGWHINNGKEAAADFFPVSKFRQTYYRPDVIARLTDTLDENEALRLANEESGRKTQVISINKMLPPVVNILSPEDGLEVSKTEITVKFSIRTPSGEPVTGIKVLVDGRPVAAERGIKVVEARRVGEDNVRDLKIAIPEKDAEISILAENAYSVSDPATVRLKWRGAAGKEEFVIKPKAYVLAVGVSRYEDKDLALGYAAKDAKDFAAAISRQRGGLYRDITTKVLDDENASKDEILDGLDWISKETTSKDVAMIFIAGHGVNDPSGIYYFLPVNANLEKLKRTGVPFSDIKNTVASLAGKTLLFVDTCHSGNVMGSRRGITDITGIVNELASAENGAVVFASSTGNQYSLEDPGWGNGAFTKALVEAFDGKADFTGKGKISINMLDLYLAERVKELTKGKQTPTTTKPQTIPDFPVAVKRE